MVTLDFGPSGDGSGKEDLKTCPWRGCPELIPRKSIACFYHRKLIRANVDAKKKTHPRNAIYSDPRWKKCRTIVLERDSYTCQYPGCEYYDPTGRTLICDHIRGVMNALDPFNPDECQTLCRFHSGKKDGKRGGQTSNPMKH